MTDQEKKFHVDKFVIDDDNQEIKSWSCSG